MLFSSTPSESSRRRAIAPLHADIKRSRYSYRAGRPLDTIREWIMGTAPSTPWLRDRDGYPILPPGYVATLNEIVTNLWRRALRRRSQKDLTTWERMTRLAADYLAPVRVLHPRPDARFDVKYPR